MSDQHTYTGTHADVLPDGRPVAPGETVTGLDATDDETRRLIDEGLLAPQDTKPATQQPSPSAAADTETKA